MDVKKCCICGGNLQYDNGLYICGSCSNAQQIETFFEDTQVFISYLENDSWGRRTKDSIIAQELYNKLQATNINTFYQRISADRLVGEEYSRAYISALDKSKIVLLVGTNADNMKRIALMDRESIGDKVIIPIISDMSLNDLPSNLQNLQVLNYRTIGASSDLVKRVLQILGRDSDIVTFEFINKKQKIRQKMSVFCVVTLLVMIMIAMLYFILGTPYVLKSKKLLYAERMIYDCKYTEAIELLLDIPEYKNSNNLLNDIYNNYDGYYYNESETICLHINIANNKKTHIEIVCYEENEIINIETYSTVRKNIIDFTFKNNMGERGVGKITLHDDSVKLVLNMDDNQIEIEQQFRIMEKSDAPHENAITKKEVSEWLSRRTTLKEVLAQGYKFKNEDSLYRIENGDIKFAFFEFDLIESGKARMNQKGDTYFGEDKYLYGISGPAKELIPDKVGKSDLYFVEGDMLYLPYASVGIPHEDIMFYPKYDEHDEKAVIKNETSVFVTSKTVLGEFNWWSIWEHTILGKSNGFEFDTIEIVGEYKDKFVLSVHESYAYSDGTKDKYSSGKYSLYNISKKGMDAILVKEQEYETDPDAIILEEFLGEYAEKSRICKIYNR